MASLVLIVVGISFHVLIVLYSGDFLNAVVLCSGTFNLPFCACLVSASDRYKRYFLVMFYAVLLRRDFVIKTASCTCLFSARFRYFIS